MAETNPGNEIRDHKNDHDEREEDQRMDADVSESHLPPPYRAAKINTASMVMPANVVTVRSNRSCRVTTGPEG